MDDSIKSKEQLIEELQLMRKQVAEQLTLKEKQKRVEEKLKETLHSLKVHQEELHTQNENLKIIQEEIKKSHQKYLELYDFAPIGYFTFDRNGLIKNVNLTGADMLGRPRKAIINKPMHLYVSKKSHDTFLSYLRGIFSNETFQRVEVELTHSDGRNFSTELEGIQVKDNSGKILYCRTVIKDITDRKRAEEELRISQAQLFQADKMSALGTMVAGVAHELINPLMSLINYIEYCKKNTVTNDERYTILENAERETNRCIAIVENLLTFSYMGKENEEEFQKESVPVIIDQILRLLEYRIEKEHVHVIRQFAEDIPEIWMRVNSIQQMFLNIIMNSLDAMRESEKKEIHIGLHHKGTFIQVTISDTGPGIAQDKLQKIFDPFFTTKPPGQGTGLGLSICQSIIKIHEGDITCKSKPGEGVMFEILLPVEKKEKKVGEE
jgi:PAS domain S-box-containing protein